MVASARDWEKMKLKGTLAFVLGACALANAAERTEHFDRDPAWDGHNNRAAPPEPRMIKQDFGYSPTAHAGGTAGGIDGLITPAGEPAYYAKKIPAATLDNALSASGKFACAKGPFHVLLGFFNSGTVNEWRTPNSVVFRLQGRGDFFYAYVEYCTSRWRAGGDSPGGFATVRDPASGRSQFKGFASGTAHEWSLRYD